MSEYRNKTTGEVKTQGQWRLANPNMSLPKVWTSATLDALNLDPVMPGPKATLGDYQKSVRDGVLQDEYGNWIERYVARDMFADTTDDDGQKTTKAEHEAAYQLRIDAVASRDAREKRDKLLLETDYFALTDVTMDAAMTTYRQSLRDITSHNDWPYIGEDWPTKP